MRALITGGSGFVGTRLARTLLASGHEVVLTGLGEGADVRSRFGDDFAERLRWIQADFRSGEAVDAVIAASQPELVFHLSGVSFPPDADRSPVDTYDVNALGVIRLLSSVEKERKRSGTAARVVVIGSGVQYGTHDMAEMPLPETATQAPTSTYAASKSAQEIAALQFARGVGSDVVCTRSFNHSGVGHGNQYLLPSLVARVRRLEKANDRVLRLGNDVVRDFLHVDDVVSAYLLLAERGRAGEVYNVSSGVGVSVRQLAERVLLRAGVSADISTEPSLMRASDTPILIGSPAKLAAETGWSPRKTYDDIIDDLLNAQTD